MQIHDVPFAVVNWDEVPLVEQSGETGTARVRTAEVGNVRVRMVEYSANYLADHWCTRGHVVLVLEGELMMELDDGRTFTITPGQSFQVADDTDPHRARTAMAAKAFVVD